MRRCILCCSRWLQTKSSPVNVVPLGESFGEAIFCGHPHRLALPDCVTKRGHRTSCSRLPVPCARCADAGGAGLLDVYWPGNALHCAAHPLPVSSPYFPAVCAVGMGRRRTTANRDVPSLHRGGDLVPKYMRRNQQKRRTVDCSRLGSPRTLATRPRALDRNCAYSMHSVVQAAISVFIH